MILNNKYNLIIFFIFFLFLFLGIFIYDDYGISWDEYNDRICGYVSLNFVRNFLSLEEYPNYPKLEDFIFANYGVIFTFPMAFIEKVFLIDDSKQYFLFRHFFLLGASFLQFFCI